MEEINYDELLNHIVIKKPSSSLRGLSLFASCYFLVNLANDGGYATMVAVAIVSLMLILTLVRYMERPKLQELVTFYNDSIKNNNFLEVDDTLRDKCIIISEYTILSRLEVTCNPEFIYSDETKVYRAQNKDIVIVNGYFEDVNSSEDVKRKYTMLFVDCNYYMCCIDNLICYDKGTYWARCYRKDILEILKIDYTKW